MKPDMTNDTQEFLIIYTLIYYNYIHEDLSYSLIKYTEFRERMVDNTWKGTRWINVSEQISCSVGCL